MCLPTYYAAVLEQRRSTYEFSPLKNYIQWSATSCPPGGDTMFWLGWPRRGGNFYPLPHSSNSLLGKHRGLGTQFCHEPKKERFAPVCAPSSRPRSPSPPSRDINGRLIATFWPICHECRGMSPICHDILRSQGHKMNTCHEMSRGICNEVYL